MKEASYRTALVAALLLVFLCEFWTADQEKSVVSPLVLDYTSSLAAGHSSLRTLPDPRLLALPNPYDIKATQGTRVLDASLFHGRYYLYFGLTPFLTLLVPWLKIFGHPLHIEWAILAFCSCGFALYAVLLADARRFYFGNGSGAATIAGVLLVGFSGGTLILLRVPEIYELEIACAYFFTALFLAAAYWSHRSNYGGTSLAVSGLALGLAVGARPTLAAMAPVYLLYAWWLLRRRSLAGEKVAGSWLLAAVPLAAIGAALAAFNFFRFGSPFEFGVKYMLNNVNWTTQPTWSLNRLPFALHRYFLGGFRLGHYFPFIEGEIPGPFSKPPGFDSTDQLYGFILTTPAFLLSLAAPTLLRQKSLLGLRMTALLGGCLSICQLVLMVPLAFGTFRYAADILPPILLIGAFCLQAAESNAAFGCWRWPAFFASAVLVCWSCLFGFLQSCALYDLLQDRHPYSFERMARVFNSPVFLFDSVLGRKPELPRLTLRLPVNRIGRDEPLLVMGGLSKQDFVYINYSGPQSVRLGLEVMGRGGPVSDFIKLDYSQPHELVLDLGVFYPPPGHPIYAGLGIDRVRELQERARLLLDGRVVIERRMRLHPSHELLFWGLSPDDSAFGSRFTGSMLKVDSIPLTPYR